ncbi:MAG: glucose-1-phosphate cytidylyltransferase [Candidatus Peribacteraceae bacterium]|nr:glucose-1-phosphate cytidylyltransferase [Candidatus Peribacteraceae bacterium]
MKVIILCGGKGTRLREETEYRPKPLVPVGGKPILWHIMKLFAHYGQKDFLCCLGYRGEMVRDYFLNYEAMNNDFTISLGKQNHVTYHGTPHEHDFNVTLVDTGDENMNGSRIKQAQKYVDDDLFMVTYGDGLADIDIRKLIAFHRAHGKLATVTTVNPASRFALLQFNENGIVSKYKEKPKMHSWISVGFFVFDKRVFDYLKTDPACVLEHGPLEQLTKDGELVAYKHEGFFYSMDTYRDYVLLNDLWKKKKAPWAVWEKKHRSSRGNPHVAL